MKRLLLIVLCCLSCMALASVAQAYYGKFDFDSAWSGDYAPGWQNTDYRHGAPPVGKMMEYTTLSHSGAGAMKLIADSTPESWMFWAAVNPTVIQDIAMTKADDPWISAWYYDEGPGSGPLYKTGQIFAVPSWVNPYIPPGEDWTDVQFGGRRNVHDNYYQVCAGEGSPVWVDTGVARKSGEWVNLKMQLSSADGKIHFFLDGAEVGQSYRDDYADLGTVGLYTMFTNPLSGWADKPNTIWDDFEYGSNSAVPEPMSLILGIMGLGTITGFRKLRRVG